MIWVQYPFIYAIIILVVQQVKDMMDLGSDGVVVDVHVKADYFNPNREEEVISLIRKRDFSVLFLQAQRNRNCFYVTIVLNKPNSNEPDRVVAKGRFGGSRMSSFSNAAISSSPHHLGVWDGQAQKSRMCIAEFESNYGQRPTVYEPVITYTIVDINWV